MAFLPARQAAATNPAAANASSHYSAKLALSFSNTPAAC